MMKSVTRFLSTLLQIILLPVFLVFFIVFIVIWGLFTITGIGPLLQYCFNRSDRIKLDRQKFVEKFPKDIRIITIPAGIHGCSESKGYKVFAIFSEPETPSKYPPVCIPNGLGATAVLISQMQERLVEQGFRVLSFDRLGVGLSDPNESPEDPTAVDIVKEMNFIMETVCPTTEKWILLGPSMGSIIAQCYISTYPEKVIGFLNMDGLPYPFFKHRNSFMWAAFIYSIYASIFWTCILRPFIGLALKSNEKMFKCRKFPLSVTVAQMNQAGFYGNVAKEMWSMMDCCEMAEIAWGKQSVVRIPEDRLKALIRAPPTVSIEFDDATGERKVTELRSESEVGDNWASEQEVNTAISYLVGATPVIQQNSDVGAKKSFSNEKIAAPLLAQSALDGEHNLSEGNTALLKFGK
jgi:pimeloyl-ACP methyl ester carboxylesterase